MQKHSTPHIISFLLIFALSIGALFSVGTLIGKTNQALAVVGTPVNTNPAGIYALDLGTGNGGCVHIVFSDNGDPIAGSSYVGHWNGSYDCVRIVVSPNSNKDIYIASSNSSVTTRGNSADSYFGSEIGLILLQSKLATAGVLNPDKINGQFSPETFEAIKAFQSKNRFETTGFLDERTLAAINAISFPATTLSGITKTIYELKSGIMSSDTSASSTVKIEQKATTPAVTPTPKPAPATKTAPTSTGTRLNTVNSTQ